MGVDINQSAFCFLFEWKELSFVSPLIDDSHFTVFGSNPFVGLSFWQNQCVAVCFIPIATFQTLKGTS